MLKDLMPGDEVYGPTKQDIYRLARFIGRGGFGHVYEVQDAQGTKYALKTIHSSELGRVAFRALVNEGHSAFQIDHPNVVRTFFFHDGELYPELLPYLIVEYADGGTLEKLLEVRHATNNYFSTEELRAIFLQLARGIKAIHEKFLHRDIKPDNILRFGAILKIADFGLSKIVDAITRSSSSTFKHVRPYMYTAPEVWATGNHSRSTDIYAMGLTFFEIATLRRPYVVDPHIDASEAWKKAHLFQQAIKPRTLNPGLDLGLAQLIEKMIEKHQEDRYASWDEIISRLGTEDSPPSSPTRRNIDSLLEFASEAKRRSDQVKIEAERKAQATKEYQGLIEAAFQQIVDAVTETVDDFNRRSDSAKLKTSNFYPLNTWSLGFILYAEGPGRNQGEIKVWVSPVYEEHKLRGQGIKAWGFVVAPSGRGFNMILVSRGPDDPYGKWTTIRATVNPILANHKIDKRAPPFPFEFHELPEQVRMLDLVSRFQIEQSDFQPDLLDPLILELLS